MKDKIHEELDRVDTDKLLEIWKANDRAEYREEAFSVIADILQSRGIDLPEQRISEFEDDIPRRELEVVVTNFRMSFDSMVTFMVKWALASIPALIIIGLIGLLFVFIFGGIIQKLL